MKTIAGLAAAALLMTTFAAPADARHRRHHRDNDVDAGDVVVGALVVGGIAALLSSGSNERKRAKQDAAVDACASEAEYRAGARVSEILNVSKRKGYYTVEGLLDGDGDGLGAQTSFTCTVRGGSIYSFRTADPLP